MLDQLILEPTRITETQANILDLFFTNNETLVNQVRIIPRISDHESVIIESSLRPMKNKILPYKVWQYRKANYDQLREELHQYQQEFNKLDTSTSTDDMWLVFKTKLTTLLKMYIPQTNCKGKQTQQAMDQ
jgi:L-lysine 2,3-aminomutase